MFKTTMKMMIALMLSASILMVSYNEFTKVQLVHHAKEVVSQQITCLAKNIYYEAAMEPYEGKLAVAQVTMNRLNHPDYPSDVCGVIYQKTGNTCQFSWVCEKVERTARDKYIWEECMQIAKRALTEDQVHEELAARNALYYHAVYVNPKWKNTKVVKKIGNHIFYVRT